LGQQLQNAGEVDVEIAGDGVEEDDAGPWAAGRAAVAVVFCNA